MELDTTLLNTQHYKVRFKGKVKQSREWSSALPYTFGVVAIEKGDFGSPSTMVDYYCRRLGCYIHKVSVFFRCEYNNQDEDNYLET